MEQFESRDPNQQSLSAASSNTEQSDRLSFGSNIFSTATKVSYGEKRSARYKGIESASVLHFLNCDMFVERRNHVRIVGSIDLFE